MIARLLALFAVVVSALFAQSSSVLSSISPSSVAAGTPDFIMTLTGGPFCSGSTAIFVNSTTSTTGGSVALSTQFITTGRLTATVPASLLTSPRSALIYVSNQSCDTSNTNDQVFVVGSPLLIVPDTLPNANVGSVFSVQLGVNGGNPPYTFSGSNVPNGLSLNASTGILSGTPGVQGDFSISVHAIDHLGAQADKSYILHVEPPILDITNPVLPNGVVGVAYDQVLKGSGGTPPYKFFRGSQGTFPPGLTFKADNSGEILGTPTVAGTYGFVVTIQDSQLQSNPRDVTITIEAPRPVITTDTIAAGNVGTAYSQTFAATGGTPPYRWSIVSSNTTGFQINSTTGVLTGIPAAAGTFSITIQVTDSPGASSSKQFALVVTAGPSITTTSLPDGIVGVAYSATLQGAGNGTLTWSVSAGALPDGLTLDPASGAVTGTPNKAGGFDFTIKLAIPSGLSATRAFHVNITAPLTISTASLADAVVGAAYSQTLQATGGTAPYTFDVQTGTLPAGLALNATTGAITGTPTAAAVTSTVTFRVTDAPKATATKVLTIRVVGTLSITTASPLPAGTVGTAYTQTFAAAGGATPYIWTAANLPAGFAIDRNSGVLTGTPVTAGSPSFTVTVTDARSTTANGTFSVTFNLPALPPPTIGGLPDNSPPARQPNVTLTLGSPFPVDITGTLTLTFASAVGGTDDAVQFTTGGRTANFTIPANTRNAVFSTANVGVVTGTVAGTITVTASLTAGGVNVTPTPAPVQRIVIDQAAPVITKVVLNTTASGYEVLVTGYSTARSVTRGTFTFRPTSTGNLQTTTLQVDLTPAFTTWFGSTAANAFGSQFTVTVPFSVSGPSNAVASVTVVLTNARGDSAAVSPQ